MATSTPASMMANAAFAEGWTLHGRTYLVTGGAQGIGLAVVRALLRLGAQSVIFCSRRSCVDLVGQLHQDHPQSVVIHVACDVSTKEGRMELFEATRKHVTVLHGLISNVGMNIRKPITDQSEDEYQSIMRTNVDSAYFLAKLFLDLFDPAGASIVHVSSAAGLQSSGTGIAYGMSKAAMNHLTRTLACEWAARNIRVNAVAPWMTMTPMLQEAIRSNPNQLDKVNAWTPMHRLATPEEIAAPIVFFCLPAASYITGQVLAVDGGLTAQGFDGPCITSPP